MSNNWRVAFVQIQKRLKDLNSYVDARDFVNANHMANLIKFSLTFDLAHEEERVKQVKACDKDRKEK